MVCLASGCTFAKVYIYIRPEPHPTTSPLYVCTTYARDVEHVAYMPKWLCDLVPEAHIQLRDNMDLVGYFGIYEFITFGSIAISCVVIIVIVLWRQQQVTSSKANVFTQTTASTDTFAQKWPVVTGKVDATRVTKKRMPPICTAFNDERR